MPKIEFTDPPESRGEQWRELPARGVFVSNLGNVFSLAGGPAKASRSQNYLVVYLAGVNRGRPIGIHRLVAHVFHGECPDGMCVDHIDCNTANNRADNLQYVTPAENTRLYWQRRREMDPLEWKMLTDGLKFERLKYRLENLLERSRRMRERVQAQQAREKPFLDAAVAKLEEQR